MVNWHPVTKPFKAPLGPRRRPTPSKSTGSCESFDTMHMYSGPQDVLVREIMSEASKLRLKVQCVSLDKKIEFTWSSHWTQRSAEGCYSSRSRHKGNINAFRISVSHPLKMATAMTRRRYSPVPMGSRPHTGRDPGKAAWYVPVSALHNSVCCRML